MRVITSEEKAAQAVNEWFNRYCPEGNWYRDSRTGDSRKYEEIYKRLKALGKTPKPEQVNEIIGNTAWTTGRCTTCGEPTDRWISVRCDSNEVSICARCISAAHKQIFPNGE